jgi:hypothetical protein
MEVTFILGWVFLAIVVGVAASSRARDGTGWFFLAVIISPLFAGLLLLALPSKKKWQEDPYAKIAAMAAVEATPENSQARRILAIEMAKPAMEIEARRKKQAKNNLGLLILVVFAVIYYLVHS